MSSQPVHQAEDLGEKKETSPPSWGQHSECCGCTSSGLLKQVAGCSLDLCFPPLSGPFLCPPSQVQLPLPHDPAERTVSCSFQPTCPFPSEETFPDFLQSPAGEGVGDGFPLSCLRWGEDKEGKDFMI